jgi:hypothetical protein
VHAGIHLLQAGNHVLGELVGVTVKKAVIVVAIFVIAGL